MTREEECGRESMKEEGKGRARKREEKSEGQWGRRILYNREQR